MNATIPISLNTTDPAPPVRDQRHMVGPRAHRDPTGVRDYWAWHAADLHAAVMAGRVIPPPGWSRSPELRRSGVALRAYVNDGRWVADCPTCNGGVAGWPHREHEHGHDQGCCLDCQTIYELSYPPPDVVKAAEALLGSRPVPFRHWRADLGETVEQLQDENEAHGLSRDGSRTWVEDAAEGFGVSPDLVMRIAREIQSGNLDAGLPGSPFRS